MAGIDPAILAQIGSSPGAHPSHAAPPPGVAGPEGPESEPVAIHEACQTACAAVQAAREELEELSSQVDMADDVDPATEKMIADAAEQIAKIDDVLQQAEQKLGETRKAHDDMVSGAIDAPKQTSGYVPPPRPPHPGG